MIPGSVTGSGVISGEGIDPPKSISTVSVPFADNETLSPGTAARPLIIAFNTGFPSLALTLQSPPAGMGVLVPADSLANSFISP